MAVIACWRSGEVEVLPRAVEGALTLARGPRDRLERALSPIARHAYDGQTLLVPGVPEAEDDGAALFAVLEFQKRIEDRLLRPPKQGAAS